MILKNRSPAISITEEEIRRLTERFKVVYDIADDPEAIPPPAGHDSRCPTSPAPAGSIDGEKA